MNLEEIKDKMDDIVIEYQEPKKENFWCEQDAKWHPECNCETQCFDCGLIQTEYKMKKPN